MVPVELSALVINERSDEQLVTLREIQGTRTVPIVIGVFEAIAIDHAWKGAPHERPLTHDLLDTAIRRLGGAVVRVAIDRREGQTYFAKVVVEHGGEEIHLDARPSDALVLALKAQVPLFCASDVLEAACS